MNNPIIAPQSGAVPMRDGPAAVTRLPVSVLMQVTPTPDHRWLDERVETLAVVPAQSAPETPEEQSTSKDGARLLRVDGLVLELHPDEAESYYLNLTVDEPRCFVAFESEDGARPLPFIVTASFDLAASYEEGDQRVDSVALDPALYQHIEAFVLLHYVPEKKIKRKRRNWSQE